MIKEKAKNKIEGIYRVASRTFGFVRIDSGEEIFVSSKDSSFAMNGDRVVVKIISDRSAAKKSREGIVLKILDRDTNIVVGYFEPSKNFAFVRPLNRKIPFDIHIDKKYFGKAVNGSIVEVKILPKVEKKSNPEGIVTKVLGHKDDPTTELTAIVHDFRIRDEFDKELLREADEVAKPIREGNLVGRRDLRKKLFITIDGEDTKDIDDAVCMETNERGNEVLYVSIADVSHYVREDSLLDREALKRGNSVYLLDRVIPMLPHVLSNGMCSLNELEDRLTLTCEMEFNDTGDIINYDIYESIINSHKRMTYTEVQSIIDVGKATSNNAKEQCIESMILKMIKVSRIIRDNRKKRGAVSFELKETIIDVDENLIPVGVRERARLEAHELIEDFMVSANETVAREYFLRKVPFLYRVHEQPEKEKLDTLFVTLESIGVFPHFKNKDNISPMDIQNLLKAVEREEYKAVIEKLVLRSMNQAKYSKDELGHFALAAKYYTHFTSPIRRYADLQIHRIIHDAIEGNLDTARTRHYGKILDGVALKISKMERVAIDCERDIELLKECEYMKKYIGDTFDGNISGMTNFGIFVELENTIEGMISLRDMRDDKYTFDEKSFKVIGDRTKRCFVMGQKVRVQLVKCTPEIRAIDFILVE